VRGPDATAAPVKVVVIWVRALEPRCYRRLEHPPACLATHADGGDGVALRLPRSPSPRRHRNRAAGVGCPHQLTPTRGATSGGAGQSTAPRGENSSSAAPRPYTACRRGRSARLGGHACRHPRTRQDSGRCVRERSTRHLSGSRASTTNPQPVSADRRGRSHRRAGAKVLDSMQASQLSGSPGLQRAGRRSRGPP
jgi:hypothetical protein